MSSRVVYYEGGYQPAAAAQNRAEQWDTTSGYTAWDAQGNVTTQRALTAGESTQLAAVDTSNTQVSNQSSLQAKAQSALNSNATFQAIASPTNAQNAAQVQALTKQCNGIIRLLLGLTDSTTGT